VSDKVINVRTPEPDPAATKAMFKELKKRDVWTVWSNVKAGNRRKLIPSRPRKCRAS
jgi:hypothetical protein